MASEVALSLQLEQLWVAILGLMVSELAPIRLNVIYQCSLRISNPTLGLTPLPAVVAGVASKALKF